MKILLSGSSGFLGQALYSYLKSRGNAVTRLLRNPGAIYPAEAFWDPDAGFVPAKPLENIDALIHLGGKSISCFWSKSQKEKIRSSRIKSTALLSSILPTLHNPPRIFLCASATGFYGDRGAEVLDESCSRGNGFLSELCQEWEQSAADAANAELRVVNLRSGIVLSNKGGALPLMLLPFRWRLGAQIGRGKQYMSWISLTDWTRAVEHCLIHPELNGPVNLVSAHPVSNAEFTRLLSVRCPPLAALAIPEFIIKTALGEMGRSLVLCSTRCTPKKLLESGFEFTQQTIDKTIDDLEKK